jgi:hypothetical protein
MSLSDDQKDKITTLLSKKIDEKIGRYARESTSMPFLARIIHKKRQCIS